MGIFIVTYDLSSNPDSQVYQSLISLIKEEGSWACLGGSSYLIQSSLSASALRDRFRKILRNGDILYVGAVSAPAAWYGYSKEVSEWIKAKL